MPFQYFVFYVINLNNFSDIVIEETFYFKLNQTNIYPVLNCQYILRVLHFNQTPPPVLILQDQTLHFQVLFEIHLLQQYLEQSNLFEIV